jgi:hypothetical protein
VAGKSSGVDHDTTIVLLFVTAGYVITQSLLKRSLSSTWRWTGDDHSTRKAEIDLRAV